MKPTKIPAAILCSSLLFGTTAAMAVSSQLLISNVQLDSALKVLTITGQGFATGEKVSLANIDITSQCPVTSGTIVTCTFPSALSPGEYRVVVFQNGGHFDVFDLTAGAVGPIGPQGPKGANGTNGINGTNGTNGAMGLPGTNGTNGTNGAQGPPGPGVNLAGQTCGTFGVMTGVSADGNTLQCRCGAATFTPSVTSGVVDSFNAFWPGGGQDLATGACQLHVTFPFGFDDGNNLVNIPWQITSGGWSACSLTVNPPTCVSQPFGGTASVLANFPRCSIDLNGDTDTATISCTP